MIKPYTYYDWCDIEKAIKALTGKDITDWNGRRKPETFKSWAKLYYPDQDLKTLKKDINKYAEFSAWLEKNFPPQDFWNHLLGIHDIHNGYVFSIDPFDPWETSYRFKEKKDEWIKEIYLAMQEVFKNNNLPTQIMVRVSW